MSLALRDDEAPRVEEPVGGATRLTRLFGVPTAIEGIEAPREVLFEGSDLLRRKDLVERDLLASDEEAAVEPVTAALSTSISFQNSLSSTPEGYAGSPRLRNASLHDFRCEHVFPGDPAGMKPYRPTLATGLDGGVEQSFMANVVHVEDALIAFGDLIPDAARGLPYGTPVHSLLVHLGDDGPEMIEFNDQGNTVSVETVKHAELALDHVRFVFRPDAGPFAGRVRLAAEIEVFEDALPDPSANDAFSRYQRFDDVQLTAICVRFDGDDARSSALREKLASLL